MDVQVYSSDEAVAVVFDVAAVVGPSPVVVKRIARYRRSRAIRMLARSGRGARRASVRGR